MVFNGLIRSFSVMYIRLAISFGAEVELYVQGDKQQTAGDRWAGVAAFVALAGYPLVCWLILMKKKEKLECPELSVRISNLYPGVRMRGNKNQNLLYYPLFLVRRIVFVALPTFLFDYSFYQVQLLIFLTSLYICSYMGVRPHWDSKKVLTECFNELMILAACYHLICFSEFNLDIWAQYYTGYSFIAVVTLVVVVNVAIVIHKQYHGAKRRRAL